MNPILLKELRQSVRNRVVLGAYLLYILLLLIAAGVLIAFGYSDLDNNLGGKLFATVGVLCAFVLFLFIPLQTLLRLIRERWRANPDLQYIAPLRPSVFLGGKIRSGFALAGLFASASLPFCFIAYFLGGVDIPNLVFCLVAAGVLLFGFLLGVILLGIAPMPKFLRYLFGLGVAILLLMFVWSGLRELLYGELEPGFALDLFERDALPGFLTLCLGFLTVAALLYTGAIAGFRAPGSNRMRPLRVTFTALWLVWPAWLWVWSRFDSEFAESLNMVLRAWGMFGAALAGGLLVFASSERPAPSQRQLQNAPQNIFRRLFAWLFDNGQLGGMSWSLIIVFISLIVATNGVGRPTWESSQMNLYGIIPMALCAYGVTFMLGWRWLLRRKCGNGALWFVVACCFVLFGVAFLALENTGILPDPFVGNHFVDDPNAHWGAVFFYIWNGLAMLAFVPLAMHDFFMFKKQRSTGFQPVLDDTTT